MKTFVRIKIYESELLQTTSRHNTKSTLIPIEMSIIRLDSATTAENISMTKDTFNRHPLRVNVDQAQLLLELINGYDYKGLTTGEVMDLNMLAVQLEDIIIQEETKDV